MKQLNSNRPKAMDKETFMQQYVLNRANTARDLNSPGTAAQAKQAWTVIQNEIKKSEGGNDE